MKRREVREIRGGDGRFSSAVSEVSGRLCKVGRLERHVLPHDHGHDFLAQAFDLRGGLFERLFVRCVDGDGQVVVAEGDPPGFLVVSCLHQLIAQGHGGIIGGTHLPDNSLDPFRHDVGGDRRERVGQNDIEGQVEAVKQRNIGEGRVALDAEDRAKACGIRCRAGNGRRVAIECRAAGAERIGERQGRSWLGNWRVFPSQ